MTVHVECPWVGLLCGLVLFLFLLWRWVQMMVHMWCPCPRG